MDPSSISLNRRDRFPLLCALLACQPSTTATISTIRRVVGGGSPDSARASTEGFQYNVGGSPDPALGLDRRSPKCRRVPYPARASTVGLHAFSPVNRRSNVPLCVAARLSFEMSIHFDVFAAVKSRRSAEGGNALPRRGRAVGLPQFDNRSVQPHRGTCTQVLLRRGAADFRPCRQTAATGSTTESCHRNSCAPNQDIGHR